jgi:3-oxoacyl-[acyl-carrier-protein] synthase II
VNPVDIVGVGAVTGYGWGFAALVDGVREGRSSARAQVVDGVETVAAVIPPGGDAAVPRFEAISVFAVEEALAEARGRGWEPGARVGVVFCTGIGDIASIRDNYFHESASPKPSLFPRLLHTAPGSILARRHGWTGPNLVVNAACSSGNAALEVAHWWIEAGIATDVVVAGAELCIIAEIVNGFRRMRVLLADGAPLTDCRPYQDGSKRFFLGEAAAGLVVTARSPSRRATYLGGASTHDAYHLVAPEPGAVQLEHAYRAALAAAGADPADVAVVKAHGSGTPVNDASEAAMLDRVFPASTRVCSYKPLIGHAMGMASLAELAALLAGYEAGVLPGPVTDDPSHSRLARGGAPPPGLVACGSVGLGGSNTVAILDVPIGALP